MSGFFIHPIVRKYAFPFLGGILYTAGFPAAFHYHSSLFFLPIFGITFLLGSFSLSYSNKDRDVSLKQELLSLLFFCMAITLFGFYWIPYTIKEFGQIPFPFNYVIGLLFSLIVAPQYVVFIFGHSLIKKINLKSSPIVSSYSLKNIFYALILSLLEYYTPQQFPAHLGHAWLSLAPHLGLAPYGGVILFSFFSFWPALAIISFIRTAKIDYAAIFFFSLFLFLNYFFSLKKHPAPIEKTNNIRMVQANIGNFLKTSSEGGDFNSVTEVYDIYEALSTQDENYKTDLIIWPETAFPRLLSSTMMKQSERYVPLLFSKVIQRTNAELFTGGYDSTRKFNSLFFETEYNAAFHFSDEGKIKDVYHKMKLIPFGEGLPFGPFNKFLSRYVQNISYFAKGNNHTIFQTRNQTPFGALICYEILFPRFVRSYINKAPQHPHFFINLTNDSWYGDTAEPYQHMYLAKWRSLEFQIPIIRMTNTGISSVIYPDGSESDRLPLFQAKVLDHELKTHNPQKTVFAKWGIAPLLLLWFTLFLLFWANNKIWKRKIN